MSQSISRRLFLARSGAIAGAASLTPMMSQVAQAATLNDDLFGQTFNQLKSKAFPGHLQLYAAPIDANFDPVPMGEISPAANQVVSIMPEWSPVGTYNSQAASFFDAYRQVLTHVTWKVSPEQQNDLRNLQNEVVNAQKAVAKVEQDMNQAYVFAKNQGGAIFAAQYPTITDWLNKSPQAKSWKDQMTQAAKTQRAAQNAYQSLVRSYQPQSLQEAQDAAKLPTGNPVNDPAPRGWAKVADGSGSLQWTPDYTIGNSNDWRNSLANGTKGQFSLTLGADQGNSSTSSSWAGGSGSYGTPFWGVESSGSWSEFDLTKNDKSVEVTITAQSSTVVPVTPGAWYDGGFISNLAKAQQGADGQGWVITSPWVSKGPENALFGKNGLLSTQVSGLAVVYKPGFKISMSEDTFRQHKDQFSASGGIRIGCFHFGGSGGHSSEWTRSTNGSTEFSGQSTSTDPLIVGVMVAFPGVGTA
ncbi:putative secreted protein [Rhodopirellula maiorica SM1]|uniref:Putative secreted protein n=1 Tax=Rhodopirellula maiorica SM1 TaxID=1265738 RepID=M5RMF5_9BACT|nr:hypothetical protein [Rhodopirellula maiorica]EMI20366.1 putative secreted protein [Rhodopirellula maiorica SM1]